MVGMPGMHPGGRDGATRGRRAFSTPLPLQSSFLASENWLLPALPHSPTQQRLVISPPSAPEKSQATTKGSQTEIPSILFLPLAWSQW